jgi:tetratricopeptide (TPR) repeat protein
MLNTQWRHWLKRIPINRPTSAGYRTMRRASRRRPIPSGPPAEVLESRVLLPLLSRLVVNLVHYDRGRTYLDCRKENPRNIRARHIMMAVFVTALTTALLQPALAQRTASGGRSGSSRSTTGTYRPSTSNYRPPTSIGQGSGTYSPGKGWPKGPGSVTNPKNNNTWPKNYSKYPKNQFWKKYAGWGKWKGPWHHGFGWGWGCWFDPWCMWPWYEVIPVAEYSNVYADCAGVIIDGIDYSVPISQMPADTVSGDDSATYASAREAFFQGDFDAALSAISQACLQAPHNHDMHQFHSLVLFARKEYCKSATVAYAVLEDGPGWTWDALQAFYPSPDLYTNQLRSLEQFVTAYRTEANVRFLLAYHYLMLNHTDVARRQLAQGVELRPADKLGARILAGIGEAAPTTNPVAVDRGNQPTGGNVAPVPQATNPELTSPDNVAPQVADPASASPITGTWKADPEKKVQIELALRDDGRFNWKFTANGRAKNFSGTYKLKDRALTLNRDGDRDAMEGTIEPTGANGFQFRMKDADAGDPGLNFTR